jgi:two-component system sensor histidine kinase YesM
VPHVIPWLNFKGMFRFSFQTKLVLYLCLAIVTVLGVASYVSYLIQQQLFESEFSKQHSKLNEQTMERLSLRIQEIYRISNSVVFNPNVEAVIRQYLLSEQTDELDHFYGNRDLDSILKSTRYDAPYIRELYVMDLKGRHLFSWNEEMPYILEGQTLKLVQEQLERTDGELVWMQNPSNPRQIVIARWMKSAELDTYGMMVMMLEESFFAQQMSELIGDDQGVAYLYDSRGLLLYVNGTGQNELETDMRRLGSEVRTIKGIPYLITVSPSTVKFTLISKISLAQIKAKSGSIFRKTALYSALIMVILCGLAVAWTGRRLLQPLNVLIKGMKQVREGDFDTRIELRSEDELAYIGQSFNAMTANVQTLIREVYETQLNQKEAELKALQAQINPHFLYNTLNTVYWQLYVHGNKDTARLVASLSGMLKYVLEPIEKPTTLGEEMQQISNYLTIQSARLEDGLETVVDIEERAESCIVFRLLLQPIVENAFNHAFKQQAHGKVLMIKSWVDKRQCTIEVLDNGSGMDEQTLLSIHSSSRVSGYKRAEGESIGLRNVIRRLQLIYGDKASLQIISKPGRGTTVKIIVPYQI